MSFVECKCNQDGGDGNICNKLTGQCKCMSGWSGKKCDTYTGKL